MKKYLLQNQAGEFYAGTKNNRQEWEILTTADPREATVFNSAYNADYKRGFLKEVHGKYFSEIRTATITEITLN